VTPAVAERAVAEAQRALRRVGLASLAWRIGLGEERRFWDRYLATGGLDWPEELVDRTRPDRPINDALRGLVEAAPEDPVRVLDVGSGPLSWVGTAHPDRRIELTAVDPLARWYAVLYERHGVEPAVRPRPGRAEHLRRQFPVDHFDVTVARNCLDHGTDPRHAITELLAVTRRGGFVYLEHAEREGANQHYRGLHQWDLWVEDGTLALGYRRARVDLTAVLAAARSVRAERGEDGWVRVWLQKAWPDPQSNRIRPTR
jgi:SAM-dependent methyltransferase